MVCAVELRVEQGFSLVIARIGVGVADYGGCSLADSSIFIKKELRGLWKEPALTHRNSSTDHFFQWCSAFSWYFHIFAR
jgi:hypothetical protein